ncbi:DMT family transporter [Nitrospirillum viridazoti]|uniref:Drug/metabolite transporter (DMT)-like permease n=1 Tax=Nitrospirillum amazonense TaxID=28077 RepID=A0A560HW62_9PROT|nr:DMT family transporter [Nitrospirillum amazonense]TWB50605.1 drug/metabolite transporter (DMT)-like permease [Nitrospirillum amazonense]
MALSQSVAWPGAPMALASAALFGASTPLAKLLVGHVDPWLLAGLLYLGSGIGLGIVHLGRRFLRIDPPEAPLRRGDLPWLAAVVLAGGVVGPVLLMVGLTRTPASSAALLLNLEGLATMGIAWLAFHENVDRRLLLGALAILAGALLLSWQGGPEGVGWGALAVAGACLAWGIDNNLTRRLSSADPVQIAMTKGLVAGSVNLVLALSRGAALPSVGVTAATAVVGFFGYGLSLVLFVLGLRHLGTARTGAYFSMAPFIGAILALMLFDEPLTWRLMAAAVLMGVGLYLHLVEHHEHKHAHEEMVHEHVHVHDEHHQHDHAPSTSPGEPHSHVHRHAPLVHRHPHYPDLHHRHSHPET